MASIPADQRKTTEFHASKNKIKMSKRLGDVDTSFTKASERYVEKNGH